MATTRFNSTDDYLFKYENTSKLNILLSISSVIITVSKRILIVILNLWIYQIK